jgi:O-antigen/teichoic acid export membrane protein
MEAKKLLLKNTAILAAAGISVQIISFFMLPFYTKYLEPTDYGKIELVTTYSALLLPVLLLRLDFAGFRFLLDERDNEEGKRRVVTNSLIPIFAMLIFTTILILVTNLILGIYIKPVIILVIFTSVIFNMFSQLSRGFGENKKYAIANIIVGILSPILSIYLILIKHMGVDGLFWSMSISSIFSCIYLIITLHLYQYFDISLYDHILQSKLLQYALPLIPGGLSWWIITALDRTIILSVLGISATGIYAVSNKFAVAIMSLYSYFGLSWQQSSSMHINDKNHSQLFSEIFNNTIKITASACAGVIAGLSIFFHYLVNNQFEESYLYVPLLITSVGFYVMVDLYSSLYLAKKQTKKILTINVFTAAGSILLNLILIKHIGLFAPAISLCISYFLMAVYRHINIKTYVQIKYEPFIFVKIFLLLGFATICYYVNNLTLNILNLVTVTIFSLWLNKSIILAFKNKILSAKIRLLGKIDLQFILSRINET